MPKILVVEDTKTGRRYMKNLLEGQSHQVTLAENGQEALNELENASFDLIFVDLLMPVMDGFKFLEECQTKGVETPIIVATANLSQKVVERCRGLGAKEVLHKPYKEQDIIQNISSLL